jgi:hypothetical protein
MNDHKNSSFLHSPRKRVVLGVAAAAGVAVTAGALALAGPMSALAATNPSGHPSGGPGGALTGTVSDVASTGFTLTSSAPTPAGASSTSGTEAKAVTVTTNSKTKYYTASTGSASDVKSGVCVRADGSSTVASVTISSAVDGKCTTIPAFVAGGPGQGKGGTGPSADGTAKSAAPKAGGSGAPSDTPTAGSSAPAKPSDGDGQKHQVLSGVVTKVDGSTVTITTKKGSKSFTVSDSTTYRDIAAAKQSALTVGSTAQVTSSNSKQAKPTAATTSKVTAKTVTIMTDSDNQ